MRRRRCALCHKVLPQQLMLGKEVGGTVVAGRFRSTVAYYCGSCCQGNPTLRQNWASRQRLHQLGAETAALHEAGLEQRGWR